MVQVRLGQRIRASTVALLGVSLVTCIADTEFFATWPSYVQLNVEPDAGFGDVVFGWEGRWLGYADLPAGIGIVGWVDSVPRQELPIGSTATSGGIPVAVLGGGGDGLTPGFWRFEFSFAGTEIDSGISSTLTIVCDQIVPISEKNAPQMRTLTVSRSGCTSEVGLLASALITDFSSYQTGQQPSDWSALGNEAGSSWTVNSGSGIGSQQLEGDQSVNGWRVITWDAKSEQRDVEILAKVLTHTVDPIAPGLGLGARASDSSGELGFYFAGLREGTRLFVNRVEQDPATGNLVATAVGGDRDWTTYSADSWNWLRFRVLGPDPDAAVQDVKVFAKMWADGTREPNFWALEEADDVNVAITEPGRIGIMTRTAAADPFVDYIAVSQVGRYAPVTLELTCSPNATSGADIDTADDNFFTCPE